MTSKRRILTVLRAAACGAVLAVAACASQEADQEQTSTDEVASFAAGRRLAQMECAGCHAVGAEGASRNAVAPPLRALAERYPGTLLADAFPERMKVGHPAMPEFRLSPSDVDALLSYLLSIQERQGA